MTRSPGLNAVTPSPTSFTMPASSLPGENGSGGLNWYLFWMIRTSGKLTLAAFTEITTSPGPGMGEGSSSTTSDSGGPYCLQRTAFIDHRMPHAQCSRPTTASLCTTRRAGSGTPIVFVHEFAGDHRSWEPQLRHFSRRYRCIAYNARGYPPSDVPRGRRALLAGRARATTSARARRARRSSARISSACRWARFATLHFGMRLPRARAVAHSSPAAATARTRRSTRSSRRIRAPTPRRIRARGHGEVRRHYGDRPGARAVPEQGPARLRRVHAPARRALGARRGEHACSAARRAGRRSTT